LSRVVLNSRHASRGHRHLAMQPRSALPTTPQPRGQPCKCLTPLSLTSLKPGAGAKSNSNSQHEETGEEVDQEQQPSAARSSGQQTAKGNSQDVQQGGSCRSRRHKSCGAAT
ncbi:hypothetical protein QJQ45_028604, partial [Haematococcus lacustris]